MALYADTIKLGRLSGAISTIRTGRSRAFYSKSRSMLLRYPNAAFALRIWLARNSVPFLSSGETGEFTEDEIEGARSFITS
jgi:hypothetical protein